MLGFPYTPHHGEIEVSGYAQSAPVHQIMQAYLVVADLIEL